MIKFGRKINLELLSTVIMFGLMFGIMYFVLIRPQKKQQEKVQDMLSNLKVGDSIVTIGGLHGIIDEINDAKKTVVLDCEGIYLTFERRAVARVVAKVEDATETEDLDTDVSDVDEEVLPDPTNWADLETNNEQLDIFIESFTHANQQLNTVQQYYEYEWNNTEFGINEHQ